MLKSQKLNVHDFIKDDLDFKENIEDENLSFTRE